MPDFAKPFSRRTFLKKTSAATLTAASMLAYLWWQRRTASSMLFTRKTLCLLLLLLIFSKGVSSYFIFWIFPLLFVCYRPILAFTICVVFMLVANIEFFVDTYWISIWTRHAMFVALFVHQALRSQKDDMGELPATTSQVPAPEGDLPDFVRTGRSMA